MNVKNEIRALLQKFQDAKIDFQVEIPENLNFGDYSTNLVLKLAKATNQNPKKLAEGLIAHLSQTQSKIIASARLAGPGFLNFTLNDEWLLAQLEQLSHSARNFAKSDFGKGQKIHLEFISANPTGPLTLANARGGFLGDVLARVFKSAGYKVFSEYYVNDRGNQVAILAESVLRRYWQRQGITIDFPETCYQGAYIDELAGKLHLPNYKLSDLNKIAEIRDKLKDKIVAKMLKEIQRVVENVMQIHFDNWFSEKALVEDSKIVTQVLAQLKAQQAIYEKDGATWLATTRYGDDKDRVLIKADGEMTYFLPDIAYHWLKFSKHKANLAINILGADHHGYVARLQAALKSLAVKGSLEVILIQFVRLLKAGEEIKMSKRRGTYVEAEEVIKEVGLDAARFFFLLRAADTHLDFDLDLAKAQNEKNPVYYVQYAHARICSILKKAQGLKIQKIQSSKLVDPERKLLLKLIQWPEVLADVSQDCGAHRIPQYALSLARTFHEFYTLVRVISEDQTQELPLKLIKATKQVLADILNVLGISAPEKM
ncbi:arginine--tRNA ligase [Candidatus Parcubacteria bacterium]|jgi:arginyl-tRNA synthetase|nr:MAG: arginine--tRNA ligase [Candidatus Parcubacteria bacterium]